MAKAHALAASKEIFAQQITKLQSSTNKQALSDEIDSLTTPSGKVRKLSSFLETIVSPLEDLDPVFQKGLRRLRLRGRGKLEAMLGVRAYPRVAGPNFPNKHKIIWKVSTCKSLSLSQSYHPLPSSGHQI